jgi:hypothetical protein
MLLRVECQADENNVYEKCNLNFFSYFLSLEMGLDFHLIGWCYVTFNFFTEFLCTKDMLLYLGKGAHMCLNQHPFVGHMLVPVSSFRISY